MPRVNHCKNKGCRKPFYDAYNKPYCPECDEIFLNKIKNAQGNNDPGTEGQEIIALPPSPNQCNPFQPRTWIIKKNRKDG